MTAVLIAGLAACAEPPTTSDARSAEDPERVTTETPDPAAGDPLPAHILTALRDDLARRSGAGADSVTVVSTRTMRWNDGAMGCPQPGQSYLQVIVDGYWVILEAQGRRYDYRTNLRGGFVLCEHPAAAPGGQPREPS
jgi:hypothetical protein